MHSSPQFILSIFWENLLECGQLFSGEILWWGGNCRRGNCPGGGAINREAIIHEGNYPGGNFS